MAIPFFIASVTLFKIIVSHIYPYFVTNIRHYFYLLDEICGKIHAVT